VSISIDYNNNYLIGTVSVNPTDSSLFIIRNYVLVDNELIRIKSSERSNLRLNYHCYSLSGRPDLFPYPIMIDRLEFWEDISSNGCDYSAANCCSCENPVRPAMNCLIIVTSNKLYPPGTLVVST